MKKILKLKLYVLYDPKNVGFNIYKTGTYVKQEPKSISKGIQSGNFACYKSLVHTISLLVFHFAQECTCREELAKEAQEQTSLKDLPTLQRLFHQSQIKGNAKLHKGKAYMYLISQQLFL